MSKTLIQQYNRETGKAETVSDENPLKVTVVGGIAPEPGSVGTEELEDKAVTTEKLADDAKAPFAGTADEANSVTWENVAGKPTAFPPDTSVKVDNATHADTSDTANAVAWANVEGKPTSFPPDTSVKVDNAAHADTADVANSVSGVSWDVVENKPTVFPPSAHTHPISDVDGLQDALDGKLSGIADGSVTTAKLAQEVITHVDRNKLTVVSGSNNDANQMTANGVYMNNGGYGLKNAPRDRYGWMLIVSHGDSNGHAQGGQLYLDYDGFDFRGFNGSTFDEWETFIIKNKVDHLEPIADPTTATTEDVANAYNSLLAALKG